MYEHILLACYSGQQLSGDPKHEELSHTYMVSSLPHGLKNAGWMAPRNGHPKPLKETCNQLLACCFYSGFRSNELVQEASSNTVIFGGISKIYWYVQESVPETLCY